MDKKFSLKKMPKPQRYGFYFLSLLALGIISLWAWQFNYRLSSPFKADLTDQSMVLNEEMFSDFQDFDPQTEALGPEDDIIISPEEDETMLYNPDEIPEETVDLPFQEPLIGDDFQIDSSDYEHLLLDALGGEADPESLRELLLASGLEEAMVYQLSDEELMSVYQEVLLGQ